MVIIVTYVQTFPINSTFRLTIRIYSFQLSFFRTIHSHVKQLCTVSQFLNINLFIFYLRNLADFFSFPAY